VKLVLDGKGGGTPYDWSAESNGLPDPGVQAVGVWLHLNRDDPSVRQWVRERADIPQHVCDAIFREDTRPRIETLRQGALVTLRGVNLNENAKEEPMIAIRMWVTDRALISLARYPFRAIGDVLDQHNAGDGPSSIGGLLVQFIDGLTVRMEQIIDDLTDRVSEVEDRVVDPRKIATRHELVELRLELITLLRYLMPQQIAIAGFIDRPAPFLSEDDRNVLREAFHRLKLYNEDLTAARDRASVIQDEITNQADTAMNNRMYIVTLIAGLFLPLTVITGLLGVNVGGIPGAESPRAFWILCALLVLIVGISYLVLRRRRWF
jgi:zinc transporter